MTPTELRQACIAKIEEGIKICEEHYGQKFEMPKITFDVRGKTAGWANWSKWSIRLNEGLLIQETEKFIDRTPLHELAHLVDFTVNPRPIRTRNRQPHGKSWKKVCRLMGFEPTRCHSYDTTNHSTRQTRKHVWVCNDCGKEMSLGPKRHTKMMSGRARYFMKGCRSHTYSYKNFNQPLDLAIAAQKQSTTSKGAQTGSKKDRARKIFNEESVRSTIISRFMTELQMSKAGASTYYYNIKSGKW